MCLYVDKEVKGPKVATEDIVCYKLVMEYKLPLDLKKYHGKEFTGIAKEDKKIKGILHVEEALFEGKRLYLCTNHRFLNGALSTEKDKHGKKYSWHFDSMIEEIMVDGVSIFAQGNYITPYQKMHVNIGELYITKLGKINKKEIFYTCNEVEEGFHSYAECPNPQQVYANYFVIRCIIPKGSMYYESAPRLENKQYCSDKLIYVELITK